MHTIRFTKVMAALMLLVLLLAVFQGASATMKAAFPTKDRIVVTDAGGALKYTTTYDESTGHLNVHILDGSDWDAYQDVVAPFNPDCRQPIEILVLPPKNAVEGCSNNFSKPMTDAKLYDYLVNDEFVWWGDPVYCGGYITVGEYIPQTDSICPTETAAEESIGFACAWKNAGGNIFAFERVNVSISWERLDEVMLGENTKPTFEPLEATIMPIGVEGLAYKSFTYDQNTGYVNIVVDTKNTDWKKVLAAGYFADRGRVSGPGVIFTPASTPSAVQFSMQMDKDTYTLPWETNYGMISCGADLGRYDEELGLFFPEPVVSQRKGVVVRYGEEAPYQRALMRLTFSDYSPVQVSLSQLTADDIIPDTSYPSVKHSFESDWVVYNDSDTQKKTLTTGVRLPAKNLSVTYRVGGSGEMACEVSDGIAYLPFELPGYDSVSEAAYRLIFRNADNTMHSVSVLTIRGVQGSPRPYPAYYGEMHAYAAGELSAQLQGGIPGTGLTYDPATGILHFKVDSEVLAAAKSYDPTLAQARVEILPPESANYYEFGSVGGTNIYDPTKYGPQRPSGDRRPVVGYRYDQDVGIDYTDFFKAEDFPLHDGKTAWYITNTYPELVGPYAGRVETVYWYANADDEEPIHISYFIKKFDPIATISYHKVVSSRNDVLDGRTSSPCLIVESDNIEMLKAELYPSAENTQYYELEAQDSNGNAVSLNRNATVFIAYPDGYDQESFMALNPAIIHYTDDMKIVEVFEEDIEYTAHGMFVTVRSLSPFVLTWGGEDTGNTGAGEDTGNTDVGEPGTAAPEVDTSDLPQTGDRSSLALWSMLAVCALVLLAGFCRRSAKHFS